MTCSPTAYMASSSSQTLETVDGPATFRKINDAVYEVHRPATGFILLDILFFHGFQAHGNQDAYWRTWTLADGSACWINTWLPEEYPQSRIMSVSYDSSIEVTDSEGRMDMYLVGENLARSIIELAGVGQSGPVVLVGHGVGGLVLKEVCCRAEQLGTKLKAEGTGINPYDNFLQRVKGAFFYSTPQLGTRLQGNLKRKRPSPLLKYYELLSADSARLNSAFKDLRTRYPYGWRTFGVIEATITETRKTMIRIPSAMSRLFGWKPHNSPMVEEGSGRIDMDDFCVLHGEDNSTICKPKERESSNFQFLLQFVQGILNDEEWALKNWQFTLQFPRVMIGMPKRVEQVLQKLRLSQAEPSRVSLVGMGGIGKSTLAKQLLVEIRSQFHFVCFVDDVKGSLKHTKLHTLIADNLYYGSGSKVRMQYVDPESVWLRLKGKKVLLIMDNVDSEEQISTLLMSDWVGKGSRLIATSRERTAELMSSFLVHEVPFLSMDESMILFRAHVDTQVVEGIADDILHQVVATCDGLPLTVEVIGSYLRFEKDVSIWKEALERLKKAESINGSADDRLWGKLRMSFDKMGPREQRMFLDLAVFDKCESTQLQYDLDIWGTIWSSIHPSMVTTGLRNLCNKCFIRISDAFDMRSLLNQRGGQYLALSRNAKFVYIHQQLRDMGRSIFRPSYEKVELCRGVWQSDDVDELLAKFEGDNAQTESLSLALNQNLTPHLRKKYAWISIGNLGQLRLFRMIGVGMIGEGAQRFPSKLAFFHMSGCFKGKAKRQIPFLESECWPIRAEDVGGLHSVGVIVLENCLSVRLPENFHGLSNLRILIISGEELTELPKNFGLLPSLQVLVLEKVRLSELPHSFLQLRSLQSLELKGCSSLETLPTWSVPKSTLLAQDVGSCLCMLKRLALEDLPVLRDLPEIFGLLGSLEEVLINRCSALVKLPESLGMCHKLKELRIGKCDSLECLGEPFGQLESLSSLSITLCPRLRCLPDSLGQLKELSCLDLHELGITSMPASLWDLHKLSVLRLDRLEHLKGLPERTETAESVDGGNVVKAPPLLRSLERLEINECRALQSLPECLGQIDSVKSIRLDWCRSLKRLPESMGLLRNLESLHVFDGASLRNLPERLGQIDSLKQIAIRHCESLERLPESLGLLRNLQSLHIEECGRLKSLPESLGQIDSLKSINLRYCRNLERLPESVVLLTNLERLEMFGSESLTSLPECLGQMDSLKDLNIGYCRSLERLPESVALFKNLETLCILWCERLKYPPGMDQLRDAMITRSRRKQELKED